MTVEQIRQVLQARPFRPFTLRLADGIRIRVPHPEFVLPHPSNGRTVAIGVPGDAFVIVDLLLVSAINLGNGMSRRKRAR